MENLSSSSSSSSFEDNSVKEVIMLEESNQKPEWLEPFMQTTFFDVCPIHAFFQIEKNAFCINCCVDICQYCLSSPAHRSHKIIQIYRHVYKEVVSIPTIENYMDCSKIQQYKCNKKMVLAIKPLPHVSTAARFDVACRGCGRRLAMPSLHLYCSISCKVKVFDLKSSSSAPPFLSPNKVKKRTDSAPKTRKQPRKGIPQRAPFF
ncbi:uncharacterized protein LOC110809748 [Carica papaya]|uniref:uncharacterized protein LOC110809748 n=1 Tax=Carica papaya TaxID=3649 RepID=UPI000B8CD705|nr:uncharacterized protein LOC110809748 [Carica papaya]